MQVFEDYISSNIFTFYVEGLDDIGEIQDWLRQNQIPYVNEWNNIERSGFSINRKYTDSILLFNLVWGPLEKF